MTVFSIKGPTKSISLPSRSHPTTLQIEHQLNVTKTDSATSNSKPSTETICNGLSRLIELYRCMDELVNSSTTRNLISCQQNMKWVDELVDESVKFLDVCGSIKDMVTHMKDHVRDLQCALRRRKGDLNGENGFANYNCFRKKMKKDVKGLIASLKQVADGGSIVMMDSDQHHLVAVIKAVIGVSETTISVFESLLMFFCVPNSKPNKWSLVVSKLMHKGIVACEDLDQQEQGMGNELESLDAALQTLCKYDSSIQTEKIEIMKSRLEKLEARLECVKTKLECLFRCLVRTRASLLNVIWQ